MLGDNETPEYINKARQKEPSYRRLYSSLLQKNRKVFQQLSEDSDGEQSAEEFADETMRLNSIFQTEVKNLIVGTTTAACTFCVTRTLLKPLIQRMVGTTVEVFQKAEQDGRRRGTLGTQRRIGLLVEGSFSLWTGHRGYDYASHRSVSSFKAISEIPLCPGRSRISEALCGDWVDATRNVPSSFWDALDEKKLHDVRTWETIRQFSRNCEERQRLEEYNRRSAATRTAT